MASAASSSAPEKSSKLYFAYGSNLSLGQMQQRCPRSSYWGIGILRGWKWIIMERGFANIINTFPSYAEVLSPRKAARKQENQDVVYGMLYTVGEEDEVLLDMYEGVPRYYEKMEMEIEVVSSEAPGNKTLNPNVKALVYIDTYNITEGMIRNEYIDRMNAGITDAINKGIPKWFFQKYMRKWVPKP